MKDLNDSMPTPGSYEYLDWLDEQAMTECLNDDVSETVTLEAIEMPEPVEAAEPAEHVEVDDLDYNPLSRGFITQIGLAAEITRQKFGRDARYLKDTSSWLMFDDESGWEIDKGEIVHAEIVDFIERCITRIEDDTPRDAKEIAKTAKRAESLGSAATVNAIESLCRRDRNVVATSDDFDNEKLLIGSPEGTIDLTTGRLRPPMRSDMITQKTSVVPSPIGTSPRRFAKFLTEIFDNDQEMIELIQRAFGCAMCGLARERMFFILQGAGGDGKSTLLGLMERVFGAYAKTASIDTFVVKSGSSHPTDLADLRGARLVVASEPADKGVLNTALLKRVTGNDRIAARFMHRDMMSFEVKFTLFLCMNKLLDISTIDQGIRDRVKVIPFKKRFSKDEGTADLHLIDTLYDEEGAFILRWVLDGAKAYLENGLELTETIKAESKSYLDGEDIVGKFLEQEAVLVEGVFTLNSDIFPRFEEYMTSTRHECWTQTSLTKDLKMRGFTPDKKGGRGVWGLRMKTEREKHEEEHS